MADQSRLPSLTRREVQEFYRLFRRPLSLSRIKQIERAALAKLRRELTRARQ